MLAPAPPDVDGPVTALSQEPGPSGHIQCEFGPVPIRHLAVGSTKVMS